MKVIGSKGKRDVGLEPKKSQLKETVVGKWRIEKKDREKRVSTFLLEQGRKDPTLHIFQKQGLRNTVKKLKTRIIILKNLNSRYPVWIRLIFFTVKCVDFLDSPAFIAPHNWLKYFHSAFLSLLANFFFNISSFKSLWKLGNND